MNWLYPNFLRRIDHYLKINYPHVWRTRVHDFGWFSLVLGNVVAAMLGMLVVGRNNIIEEGQLITMHIGLTVLLSFVSLFWVVHLVRYKLKFSDFRRLLTTWFIYVLCLLSLGLNVSTFTSAVAYRTASLDSGEVLAKNGHYIYNDLKTYEYFSINMKAAETFAQQPFLKRADYCDYKKRSYYHELLNISWSLWIIALFFLPALLFLLSVFGVRTTLISAFLTTMIVGLRTLVFNMFHAGNYYAERLLSSYVIIAFVLIIILMVGRNRLRSWNNIAGTLLLMTGVIFFTTWVFIFRQQGRHACYAIEMNFLPMLMPLLPFSLLISVVIAWLITKHKDEPILH